MSTCLLAAMAGLALGGCQSAPTRALDELGEPPGGAAIHGIDIAEADPAADRELVAAAEPPAGLEQPAAAETPAALEQVAEAGAEPRLQPIAASGASEPYEAPGRSDIAMRERSAFSERGLASWYGRKFHGRRTASGERYDMYAMTAAHPTLPLPSYARVRNPANGREVVVRINDRGPFHRGRVIDLSYTAALQLGVLRTVAAVEVERITEAQMRTVLQSPAATGKIAATPQASIQFLLPTGAAAFAEVSGQTGLIDRR